MTTLLTKGQLEIMALFYKDKKAKIHLRDIARKTKLNEHSAARFLNQLETQNLLKSEKDGNLKKYSIIRRDKTFAVFTLFDIDKFDKLPLLRKHAIEYFIKTLKEKPIIIILFGSTARETYRHDSDIDLMLVVNKEINTKEAENYAEAQTNMKISCFMVDYPDFLREIKLKDDHVLGSAIETGYPLTNHIQYYEAVL